MTTSGAHVDITKLREQLDELTTIVGNLYLDRFELERQLHENKKLIVVANRAVEAKRSEIHQYVNDSKPIVSLPPEILSLILLDVVSFHVDHGPIVETVYPTPCKLALVCKRWRRIILGDPRLWTHINLDHLSCCKIKVHLSRTAGLPLDLSISLSKSSGTNKLVWDQFVREAHKWGRLWIDSSSLCEDVIRPVLTQKRAESLRYICLVNNRIRDEHIRPLFASRQNHLRTLVLIRTPMPKRLIAPHVQHLTFTGGWEDNHPELTISYHRLRHLLSFTSNLQTLGIGVNSVTFGLRIEPIILPRLRHFTLYFHESFDGDQLSDLLDMISAPALQIIELSGEDGTCDTDDEIGYSDFVVDGKPRYPTVSTAILYNAIYYDTDAEHLIDAFPNIKSLTTSSSSLPHIAFVLQENWTSLDHIRVHVAREHHDDFEESDCRNLVELLKHQRRQGVRPLQLELVIDQLLVDEEPDWFCHLNALSSLTILNAARDTADGPWKFWANYGRSCWLRQSFVKRTSYPYR